MQKPKGTRLVLKQMRRNILLILVGSALLLTTMAACADAGDDPGAVGQVDDSGAVQVEIVPPQSTLSADGDSQTGAIGSYCWETACVDAATIAAPEETLRIEQGAPLAFRFGGDAAPSSVTAAAYPVDDTAAIEDGQVRLEQPLPEPVSLMTSAPDNDVEISTDDLAPGDYIVTVFVDVPDGDAAYNYHIVVE